MDILVELEDGSYSNVKIQKIGYYFCEQRISCYISNLIQRQYAIIKAIACTNGEPLFFCSKIICYDKNSEEKPFYLS